MRPVCLALVLFSLVASFRAPLRGEIEASEPPILVIVADDFGWDLFERAHTPNLDALMAESLAFTEAWAYPACAVTRGALLTGRHPSRTGVGGNLNEPGETGLEYEEVTIGELLDEPVDFVIVGSGSAGGIIAEELSTDGFKVVVLEQGPYRKAADFSHDELSVLLYNELSDRGNVNNQQTFRDDPNKVAELATGNPAHYAQGVGGSSVHFTANFWRLRESDFKERSLLGPISGTNFADWPISYAELEPYYTRVDL